MTWLALALVGLLVLQVAYDRRLRREIARRGEVIKHARIDALQAKDRVRYWRERTSDAEVSLVLVLNDAGVR